MEFLPPMPVTFAANDAVRLLPIVLTMIEDAPLALVLVDATARPLWFNQEAAVVCAVWNSRPQGGDALPLDRGEFRLPVVLQQTCRAMVRAWQDGNDAPPVQQVAEPGRGLYAAVRLSLPEEGREPILDLQLDYRRPRADRQERLSPAAVRILARLSFREREVAMRVRDGLTTPAIAAALHRSPLTIKTQLSTIFRKLHVSSRVQLAALLNR